MICFAKYGNVKKLPRESILEKKRFLTLALIKEKRPKEVKLQLVIA